MYEREFLRPYLISIEDFRRPDVVPVRFVPGDKVDRNNFCSLLVATFAKSQGVRKDQRLLFEEIFLQNSFDYRTTFKNFIAAGGWECFSEKEKDMFKIAFDKILKHQKIFNMEQKENIIANELKFITEYLDKPTLEEFQKTSDG